MDKCAHRVYGLYPGPCGNSGKVEHEGKAYCGVHDPVKRQAKRDETTRKYREKSDRDVAVWTARARVAASHPDLLAACESAENWLEHHGADGADSEGEPGLSQLLEMLRAAIAKARS